MAANLVPNYELYGEFLSGAHDELVHFEPLKERSSQIDWTIRLHRHARLVQVFSFQTPGVFVRVGEDTYTTTHPVILLVP